MISASYPLELFHLGAILVLVTIFFIQRRKKIDSIIFFILLFWISINVANNIFRNQNLSFNLIIGSVFRIVISYLILKTVGDNFWVKFEKLIYFLTKISLIIYFFLLLFPSFNNILSNVFGGFLTKLISERFPGSWYAFFYTHLEISGYHLYRNSGFMWEPGALSMILIIAIIINWMFYGIKINKRIFIYFIAIISTFSTAGYLAVLLLVVQYFLFKNISIVKKILCVVLFAVGIPFIINLSFIKPKIEWYLTDYKEDNQYENAIFDKVEYNRIAIFSVFFDQTLDFPIGYGLSDVKVGNIEVVGVNGLGYIMRNWGFFGLLFSLLSMYFFLSRNYQVPYNSLSVNSFLSFAAILIVFFSNPIQSNPIFYLIILTPYVLNKK
jgi:hypothetical protein